MLGACAVAREARPVPREFNSPTLRMGGRRLFPRLGHPWRPFTEAAALTRRPPLPLMFVLCGVGRLLFVFFCFVFRWPCTPLLQSYLVEPKNFNAVQEVVAKESRGSGSVTVSSVAVVHDDEDGEL